MGKINVLSFAVANLIAAGEVVDRPASVIKELMENAIDSGADRIVVEIQNGGTVFMRVSDNGCGISTEHIGHIFEPFYRVDKARSRMKGGSGLGLPLCYKIAQIHGGSIDVKSVVGEGTTFLVNLPFDNLLENIRFS